MSSTPSTERDAIVARGGSAIAAAGNEFGGWMSWSTPPA